MRYILFILIIVFFSCSKQRKEAVVLNIEEGDSLIIIDRNFLPGDTFMYWCYLDSTGKIISCSWWPEEKVLPEPRPIPVVDSLPKGVLTPIDTSKRIQVYYTGVPTVTTPKLTVIPERSYSKCCGTPFGMFCYCSPAPDLRDSIISIDTIKLSIWGEPIPPPTKSRIKLYDPDTVKGKRAIICEYKDINRIMNGPPVLYREIK